MSVRTINKEAIANREKRRSEANKAIEKEVLLKEYYAQRKTNVRPSGRLDHVLNCIQSGKFKEAKKYLRPQTPPKMSSGNCSYISPRKKPVEYSVSDYTTWK